MLNKKQLQLFNELSREWIDTNRIPKKMRTVNINENRKVKKKLFLFSKSLCSIL